MNKIKDFLKILKLSDFLFLLGFIPFIFFLVGGKDLMQMSTGTIEVMFPIWVHAILFAISLVAWGYYLLLELKAGYGPKRYISILFIFLIVFSLITIFVQPVHFSQDVVCRLVNPINEGIYPGIVVGDVVTIEFDYDIYHYLYFAMYITLILVFIYIGFFVFPKRFTGVTFIKYLTFGFYIFLAILIISGYITEHDKYVPFINSLLTGDKGAITEYAVFSFIIHRNAYGMCMLMGIIFSIFNHALDKKWWYYLIIGFLYVNMFFSWSISSLAIGFVLIALYVLFRLIFTFKEHKKRNSIILISIGGIAVIGLGLVAIAYLSEGKYLGFIYSIINGVLGGGSTISSRTFIWDNIFLLLRDGWWLIGRGFGMFNVGLMPMNIVNGDPVFPAHSSYLNVLVEGGIVYLFVYLAYLAYLVYIIYKCFKKEPGLTIAISCGVLAFSIYGFVEAIEYLVYTFTFPLLIFYYSLYPEEKIMKKPSEE